jgi:hypothetical protein
MTEEQKEIVESLSHSNVIVNAVASVYYNTLYSIFKIFNSNC